MDLLNRYNNQMDVSIIIPAYNESDNFHRGSLDVVLSYLKGKKFSWEVILVNDGSTDDTSVLLHKFAKNNTKIRVIDNPHQGKAATVITGALSAEGEIILFSDMDQATPISEFDKFLPLFKQNQVVIGSRKDRAGAPAYRQILAFGMVVFRTLLLRLPYRDTQCGFKAFTRDSVQKIFPIMLKVHPPKVIEGPAVNAGFDVELLYLARKLGYKVAQVPVSWRYQESRRVSFVKDAVSSIEELFLVRWRSLLNTYRIN